MIAAIARPLSERLGVPWGLRWFFDHPVMAVGVLWFLSPGVMWINDVIFVRGSVVPPSYQWFSALCDPLLALGVGGLLWALGRFATVPGFLQHWWVHVPVLVLFIAGSVQHTLAESGDITTLERRLGPNSIYHNMFLFPVLGYIVALVFLAAAFSLFTSGPSATLPLGLAILFALGCVYVWYRAGVYDGTHQFAPDGVSKHSYANPEHPWRDGYVSRFAVWAWRQLF